MHRICNASRTADEIHHHPTASRVASRPRQKMICCGFVAYNRAFHRNQAEEHISAAAKRVNDAISSFLIVG
jgi:hypothetical protein